MGEIEPFLTVLAMERVYKSEAEWDKKALATAKATLLKPTKILDDQPNDEALMREVLSDCLQGQEVSAEGLTPKTAENTLRFLIDEGWPLTDEMIGDVHFDRWMGPIDYDGVIEQRDQMLEFQKERAERGGIEPEL